MSICRESLLHRNPDLTVLGKTGLGWWFPSAAKDLEGYIILCIFVMLFPMMIRLLMGEASKDPANLELTSSSMLFNLVLSHLLAALLARIFSHQRPDFAVSLISTGTVPRAGMVADWTGYAKANVALPLMTVTLSLLLSIMLVPCWMPISAGLYVQIDVWGMSKEILVAVVVSLILSDLTRRAIVGKWGQGGLMKSKPILPAISMLGMCSIVSISTALEAYTVVESPDYFLVIIAPLGLFYVSLFASAALFSHLLGFSYEDMAFSYGTAGKNICIGLVTLFFSPPTVFVLALKSIQIAFMAGFLRLSTMLQR